MAATALDTTILDTSAQTQPTMGAEQETSEQAQQAQVEGFVGRFFEATLGAMDLLSICLGDRLGLYRALADGGPATSAELAARTGIHERYAREWLEQQAVANILEVVDEGHGATTNGQADGAARRYRLPASRVPVLLDGDSPAHLAPLSRVIAGIGGLMPRLLEAYRTGGGIGFSEFTPDVADVQAALTRPFHVNLLAAQWLPAIPEVHARLQAGPLRGPSSAPDSPSSQPARVADIGCGAGWSSIAIARAYPNVCVDGFDLDAQSIELARRNAEAAGVSDRVSFTVRDVTDPTLTGSYDLVLAFELIHDLSRPVEALRSMRRLAAPGGYVLNIDQRAAESFAAPGDPIQRLFYSTSLFVCLPWGMAEQPSAATGTVMRPTTLHRYAQEAGFRDVEILPIEHDFFRFYHPIG